MTTFAIKKRIALGWGVGVAVFALAAWAALAGIQRPAAYGPALLPPSQLWEGTISEIRGTAAAPHGLNISQADGSALLLAVDPLETVVLQGGRVAEFETLEKGQRVKARYAFKDGREVARSIEIVDPLPMPAPTDKPVPTPPEKPLSEF